MVKHYSIIGMPQSGKTTYLAAFWYQIEARDIQTGLVLDRLEGDASYLNRMIHAWMQCETVPRTSMAAEAHLTIHVRDTVHDNACTLSFPDLSGETFEWQLSKRSCTPEYVDSCSRADGLMLFTTADRRNIGISIADLAPALVGAEEDPSAIELPQEWSHKDVPEQVQLVELLQFLLWPPFVRQKRRLAIIVSAWDVILSESITPEKWLQCELPLLHQFLLANSESYEVQVFGVSAQGGDFSDESRERLLHQTPTERIRCVYEGVVKHDITAPLFWLMGT